MIHVMADVAPIGVRIARRRQALGLRQEDLAAKLGVARVTVSNWESGKHPPKRKLGAIEAVLGISLDDGPGPNLYPNVPKDLAEYVLRRHSRDPDEAEAILADLERGFSRRPRPEPGEDAPRRRAV